MSSQNYPTQNPFLESESSFANTATTETGSASRASREEKLISDMGSQLAYNELSDFPVQTVDPVEMVEKNLQHLTDLQGRMRFMMKEIRYLLKA
jgi:hypothetical protein